MVKQHLWSHVEVPLVTVGDGGGGCLQNINKYGAGEHISSCWTLARVHLASSVPNTE